MEDLGGVISKEGGGWSKDCRWEVDPLLENTQL